MASRHRYPAPESSGPWVGREGVGSEVDTA
ncbi:Uncharacterised protein [Bordetella pertussis]|nr:Uncharacterised protein [Bordetella pertussis]